MLGFRREVDARGRAVNPIDAFFDAALEAGRSATCVARSGRRSAGQRRARMLFEERERFVARIGREPVGVEREHLLRSVGFGSERRVTR